MRVGVLHVIATTLHRGQCNANAHYVHVRRSLVLGNPGRRAQIVFPRLRSLELLSCLLFEIGKGSDPNIVRRTRK